MPAISNRKRARLEVELKARLMQAWKPYADRARRNQRPAWVSLERDMVKRVGPVLLETQREAAVATLLEQVGSRRALEALGFKPDKIQPALDKVATTISEWQTGKFPGNGSSITDTFAGITYVSVQRWQVVKGQYGSKPPASALAKFVADNYSRKRANIIAATELTRAITKGQDIAVAWIKRHLRLKVDRIWITQDDERVCPICGPLHNQPEVIWREVVPQGSPAHPICRCDIQVQTQPILGE